MAFPLTDLLDNYSRSSKILLAQYRRIIDAISEDGGIGLGKALLPNLGLLENLMSIIALDVQKPCDNCGQEDGDADSGIRILAITTAAWLLSGVWLDNQQYEETAFDAIYRIGECSDKAKTIISWTIRSIRNGLSLLIVSSSQMEDFNGLLLLQFGLFLLSNTAVSAVVQPFLPEILSIATTILNQISDLTQEQRQRKTIELALRMVLNMFVLFTPATIFDVAPSTTLTVEIFNLLLKELANTVETEHALIVDLSLQVLLLCPINEIACIDENAVNSIGLLTKFIRCQVALQDASCGIRVERCAKLWKLWLRVLSYTRASNKSNPCFGDLIAPINGVGSLMQPFQLILKTSRSLAAECLALLMDFVHREGIREHVPPFKLLLRCFNYILFSEPQDIDNNAAFVDYARSMDVIFESIRAMAVDLPWSLVGDVLQISVLVSNKRENRSHSAESSAVTPSSRNEQQKISLWTILIKLVSMEDKPAVLEVQPSRTAVGCKRIEIGARILCLLLSKCLSILVQVEVTEQLHNVVLLRKNSLHKRGLFSNRFVHSIFCNKLPTFQAKLLPQMKQACSIPQIYQYIQSLLSCMQSSSVLASDEELSVLNSSVSCWQIVILYLASYLMLETSDGICQELSSPGSERIKLVGMSSPSCEEKAGAGKLYHVTQMEYESYVSAAPPPADISSPNSALSKANIADKEPHHQPPTNSSSLSVTTEDYDTQYVLCSNYPPAIEASQIVFTAAMERWTAFWMSTNVGRTAHLARSIFLESLWWFVHRITGFMFSFSVPEPLSSFRAELLTRQRLESGICPHTMGGVLYLMTLSHIDILEAQRSHLDRDPIPIIGCWKIVQICLRRSLNSITESGLLPLLINWMPTLLTTLLSTELRSYRHSRDIAQLNSVTVAITVKDISFNRSLLSQFLILLQSEYCAHLATMVSLSPSEQCSPSVLHNIISGLRNLVSIPLIALITSQQFGNSYWTTSLDTAKDQERDFQDNNDDAIIRQHRNSFLENNRKLLILWLQLEITHGEAIDIGKVSGEETHPKWSQNFFGSSDDVVCFAPFTGAKFENATFPGQSLVADFRFSFRYLHMLLDVLNIHGGNPEFSSPSVRVVVQYVVGVVSSLSLSLLRFVSCIVQRQEQPLDPLLSGIHECISDLLAVFKTTSFLFVNGKFRKPVVVYVVESGDSSMAWKDFVLERVLDCIVVIVESMVESGLGRMDDYEKAKELVEQSFLSVMSCCGAIKSHGEQGRASNTTFPKTLQRMLRKVGGSVWRLSSVSSIAESLMANTWQLLLTSWAEFGDGRDLRSALSAQSFVSDSTAKVIMNPTTSTNASSSTKAKANLKRSFAETVACSKSPDLVNTKAIKYVSQPPNSLKKKTDHNELASPQQYLKLQLSDHDLGVLEERCRKARQGVVPVTYSSADRAQLDAQSQLIESQGDLLSSLAPQNLTDNIREDGGEQEALDAMITSVAENNGNEINESAIEIDNGCGNHNLDVNNIVAQEGEHLPMGHSSSSAVFMKESQAMGFTTTVGTGEQSRDESECCRECVEVPATLCDEDDLTTGQMIEAMVEEQHRTHDESAIFAQVLHHIDTARSTLQNYQQVLEQQPRPMHHPSTDNIHRSDKILSMWYESNKLTNLLYELREKLK